MTHLFELYPSDELDGGLQLLSYDSVVRLDTEGGFEICNCIAGTKDGEI